MRCGVTHIWSAMYFTSVLLTIVDRTLLINNSMSCFRYLVAGVSKGPPHMVSVLICDCMKWCSRATSRIFFFHLGDHVLFVAFGLQGCTYLIAGDC